MPCAGRRPICLELQNLTDFSRSSVNLKPQPQKVQGMQHPRRFARIRPTGKISSGAKIIVGPKAPVIDCKLIDYSAGGACIEIFGQVKVPNRFELLHGGTKKRCRIVWSVGRRLGVSF